MRGIFARVRSLAGARTLFSAARGWSMDARPMPVNEDHPVAPLSFYAANKLCCEQYHRAFAASDAITFHDLPDLERVRPRPANSRASSTVSSMPSSKKLSRARHCPSSVTAANCAIISTSMIWSTPLCSAAVILLRATRLFNTGSGVGIRLRDAAEEIRAAATGPLWNSAPGQLITRKSNPATTSAISRKSSHIWASLRPIRSAPAWPNTFGGAPRPPPTFPLRTSSDEPRPRGREPGNITSTGKTYVLAASRRSPPGPCSRFDNSLKPFREAGSPVSCRPLARPSTACCVPRKRVKPRLPTPRPRHQGLIAKGQKTYVLCPGK